MAVVLVAGCSKLEVQAPGFGTDPDAVRVEASVGVITKTSPLGTPDEQVRFNDGDQIAVSNGSKTVKYKFDGTSWAPVADENGATDYLVWDTPVTFRAWYPASASWDKFSLPTDQSEDIAAADFMTCSAEYKDDAAIPQERKLSLVMTRHMALVTIIIDKIEEQYGDIKDPEFRNAKISSAHASVYRQSDGTYGSAGAPREISPVEHEIGGKTAYSAIVTPGKADNNWGFLRGYIGNDGSGYNDVYVTGLPAAEAGKHYTYKLVIGKETVKIGGVTVEDWTTGFKLDGKFEAEVDDYSEWDGKKVSGNYYFSGKGSETDPYLIKSATDLAGLAANVNGGEAYSNKYFRLETNIDLMGHEWTPIGDNDKNGFSGIFDGGGCSIINLNISKPYTYSGLFGVLDGGEIKNLDLKNCHIGSKGCFSGLLVAYMRSAKVEDCNVQGEITVTAATVWDYYCGGIVGKVVYFGGSDEKCVISDCEAEVNISPASEILTLFSGGIVGQFDAGTIEDCKTRGKIAGIHVGGIAGSIHADDSIKDRNRSIIKRCDSYAVVIGNEDSSVLGGFIGHAAYCTISSCFVYGTIDASEFKVFMKNLGGSFGVCKDNVSVTDFHFHGNIILPIEKGDYYGAFIGWLSGGSLQTEDCTYDKSGVGGLELIGKIDSGIELGEQDIKGI